MMIRGHVEARPWKPQDLLDDLQKMIDEDPDAYYQEHRAAIDGVIKWADQVGMYVGFGTSTDNTYLCEYDTTQFTKSMCIGLANELKVRLKAEWKSSVKLGYQAYGDSL